MLSEREQQHVKRIAKKHRSRAKIVNAESIPARDTDDAYGNPFLGLPANRLKYQDLSNDELGTNAIDRRTVQDNAIGADQADSQFLDVKHFPITGGDRRIPAGVRFALGDALGVLDVIQLGGGGAGHLIDKDLIPGIGSLNGSLGFGEITGNIGFGRISGKLPARRISGKIAKSNISGVNWDQVDNKPPLATKHYVDKAIDDLWQRALNKFQKKP